MLVTHSLLYPRQPCNPPYFNSLPLLSFASIASCVHEQCSDEDLAAHHLLLFISALIPKAMSSLLTSVVIELSKTENRRWRECCCDESLLEDVLLEVQRLWPPFFGGRRICTQVHYPLNFLLPVCPTVCLSVCLLVCLSACLSVSTLTKALAALS